MVSELPPVEAGPEPAPEPEPEPEPEPARVEPKKRGRPAGAKNKPKPKAAQPKVARVRTPSPEPVYEPRREDIQLATRYFVSQIANHRQALLTSKREGWKAMFN